MALFDWKPLIIPIITSFISGIMGGLWSAQQRTSDLETRLTTRIAILETRGAEFDRGAEERKKAISDCNKGLSDVKEMIYLHELRTPSRNQP